MNRSVPVHPTVPPVGAALVAVAAVLATLGLGVRLFDVRGVLGSLLSLDAPGSLARVFVVGVLAAVAAVAGWAACARRGCRVWWSAVAVAGAWLAIARLMGDLDVRAIHVIGSGGYAWRAGVVVGLAVTSGLLVLRRLRGPDRRDRRRILAVLGANTLATLALSVVATYAHDTGGPISAAFAVFVQRSAEALTAAALLVAVLVAVLPRSSGARVGESHDEHADNATRFLDVLAVHVR